MNSELLDRLQEECDKHRHAARSEIEVSALQELLSKCIDAGATIADSAKRTELQRMARDIGDLVFSFSNEYPTTAIATPDKDVEWREKQSTEPLLVDIHRLPITSQRLVGRDVELAELDRLWANSEANVVTIVAFAGVGKTALVDHWLGRMKQTDWRGAERVFGWVFSSQGSVEDSSASDPFFEATLRWFGETRKDVRQHWQHRAKRLAELVSSRRTLLILDGLEAIQFPPGTKCGLCREPAMRECLKAIAASQHGLCVITTRLPVTDLADLEKVSELPLENLNKKAGCELLTSLGVKGSTDDVENAVDEAGGHALTLTLLGTYLSEVWQGDITRRDKTAFFDSESAESTYANRLIRHYEDWFGEGPELQILRTLGLFNRAAKPAEVNVLRRPPPIPKLTDEIVNLDDTKWNVALSRLRDSQLLRAASQDSSDELGAHPLVRSYFANSVRTKFPQSWAAGHQRLFKHLDRVAPDEPKAQLEMMQLFDVVRHGCHAGEYTQVLKEFVQPRILKWDEETRPRFYSTNTLGLWGETLEALRLFFVSRWNRVRDELCDKRDQAFVFTSAGTCLRALYRFPEAIEATTHGLKLREAIGEWSEAGFALRMLNQIHIAAGNVEQAKECGERSVELSDKGTSLNDRVCARARYAESLHHGAQNVEELQHAKRQFEEALRIWKESNPDSDLLDGFSEFEYCDLLITLREYSSVSRRARSVLEREDRKESNTECRENSQPLWTGLGHLALGRIDFIKACDLEASAEKSELFKSAGERFESAKEGLDRADEQQHVPFGYLAQARLHCEMGKLEKADDDLNEVENLARPNEMQLHMTDYHLIRAHVEFKRGCRDEAILQLEQATGLIQATGYFRREEELRELRARYANS